VSVDQVGADVGTAFQTLSRNPPMVSVDQVGADVGTTLWGMVNWDMVCPSIRLVPTSARGAEWLPVL